MQQSTLKSVQIQKNLELDLNKKNNFGFHLNEKIGRAIAEIGTMKKSN